VCSLNSPAEAEPLAACLIQGGLPLIEVTLRSPGALRCLEAMAAQPGLLVGAGTVRTAQQMRAAVDAGAAFVVSPCLTDPLAAAAAELNIPFLPGASTATEIQRAADAGFSTIKFFPAEAAGGLPTLAALAEPFHEISFVPTGGITAATAPAYLAHPRVAAVGGGWMVPAQQRSAGDWAAVTASVAAASCLSGSAS
jgi:2-dehydro-3-deoxyphosphogluconate aldolase/(4S)-4-hydroxy-2-oxoglutarate aldolase